MGQTYQQALGKAYARWPDLPRSYIREGAEHGAEITEATKRANSAAKDTLLSTLGIPRLSGRSDVKSWVTLYDSNGAGSDVYRTAIVMTDEQYRISEVLRHAAEQVADKNGANAETPTIRWKQQEFPWMRFDTIVGV